MKFARYLQDSQTPEWKKVYIDYRGLKAQLGLIRAQVPRQLDSWSSFGNTEDGHTNYFIPKDNEGYDGFEDQEDTSTGHVATMKEGTRNLKLPSFNFTLAHLPFHTNGATSHAQSHPTRTRFRNPAAQLGTVLSGLPAAHLKFFDMLDAELAKVETFYAEREKEMHDRDKLLRGQLDELAIHRQMFYATSKHSKARNRAKRACLSVPSGFLSLIRCFRELGIKQEKPPRVGGHDISAAELGLGGEYAFVRECSLTQAAAQRPLDGDQIKSWKRVEVEKCVAEGDIDNTSSPTLEASVVSRSDRSNSIPGLSLNETKSPLDPLEYQRAKRRLRHAVFEHYRGLEVLNNYRILNLTGFRKVLKKYGKITKISALDAYIKEKVEPCTFASGAVVSAMLKETETLFAMRFEHGDRKKATDHLRVGPSSKTRHLSTCRSGLWLGLAAPAIVAGFYQVFQEDTRASLQSWDILLYIYSIFVLPVLLALLIGINILVWVRKKISYVFIFKLNLRSKLDHREYFELPSFLLCALAYAFWFSFARIGPPTLWPLIWLAITVVTMFNPLRRSMWGRARWWTIKKTAKLVVSGVWIVEFTDVWLGDQFCSLGYTLSHLYFVGCFYSRFFILSRYSTVQPHGNSTGLYDASSSTASGTFESLLPPYDPGARAAWSTCGAAQNWGWYCLLGILPFIARFVQNLRRYRDSKLPSQLINAGKYGMGIIQYFFYCYWRYQNGSRTGKGYILWFFTATIYSMYATAWDVLMDWSMGKPHAPYPLLRSDLVYSSHIPLYYFALVSNLVIRFIWLSYLFVDEANYNLCTFIVALLEMLRRVQWNFYRLEGKHLHNMGLHRITRDIPLPYHVDAHLMEKEARLRKRLARLS